jgi:hypothetical protein
LRWPTEVLLVAGNDSIPAPIRRRTLGGAALALLALPGLSAAPAQGQGQGQAPPVPMMGKRVFAAGGEELGRVVDVVLDLQGRPAAVVIDVGGFMGLGARRVAIAWAFLRLRPDEGGPVLWIDMPPDVVIAAPEFRREDAATIFDPVRTR